MPVRTAAGSGRDVHRFRCGCARLLAGIATAGLLAGGGIACARELPLWELGAGVFPSTFPAYRGSSDQVNYLLPVPYVAYRGDILRIDREGMRARLFDSDRVEINISVNGAIPVDSSESGVREGMPDLDPTVEVGPSLDVVLDRSISGRKLKLKLPVRTVIATDLTDTRQVGWIFNPQLNLDYENVLGGWGAGLSAGPLFGDREYHAYYYDVAPAYATADRPAYRGAGGYSGSVLIGSMSRRFERIWVGAFFRYDNLSGAVFDDSPLLETDHSFMGGVAVSWILKKSARTVDR